MKKVFLTLLFVVGTLILSAQPLWMRYPAISPDGTKIAFCYKGDIYSVSTSGGSAKQLTTGNSYESNPIWSPDGKKIAFSTTRNGNNDVYIMLANGGEAARLTHDSYGEVPTSFTPKGDAVIFTSMKKTLASDISFQAGSFLRTYKVSIKGGSREELVLPVASESASISKDGSKIIYQNIKGYENNWRKHHTSSITRDICLFDTKLDKYSILTTNNGEDRNPLFSKDEKTIYYLSEREGGTFNVFSMDILNPKNSKQISSFKKHPVRFLSASNNDLLCYGYHGEIYTQAVGGTPKKVNIELTNDTPTYDIATISMRGGITSVDVSLDGSQIAYVIRGEVYVTSVDFGLTKRITNTPQTETSVTFSPDGRALVYSSDRDGNINIYRASIVDRNELNFATATVITETAIFQKSNVDRMSPTFSPDGKKLAFIESRNILKVLDIKSGKAHKVTNGDYHFKNDTYGFSYKWSPDGKWFIVEYVANKHDPYGDVGIVSSAGGEITNITESGYMSGGAEWALNGAAVVFQTERFGMRNHASWGSLMDIMIAFVNQDAFDKFTLSEKEYSLLQAEDKRFNELKKMADARAQKKSDGKKPAKKSTKKSAKKAPVQKTGMKMELSTITDRIIRLTPYSASYGGAIISSNGAKMYYNIGPNLYEMTLKSRVSKVIAQNTKGALFFDKSGQNLFVISPNSLQKIVVARGLKSNIPFEPIMNLNKAAERAYMFNHVYIQELKRFYVEDLNGVDWKSFRKEYEPHLKHINNNHDFAEFLSEILGELNVSHTGARYSTAPSGDNIAELGLFFNENHKKDGLLVEEVIKGSPFDKAKSKLKKGDTIIGIDGYKITAGMSYYHLLNYKTSKRVLVTIKGANGVVWNEVIKPISKAHLNDGLLYNRWAEWQANQVETLSKGRLGYVHVKVMDDNSFRTVYSDILGKYNNCEAIVIDTRNNGGGRLHEDIEILFSGEKYLTQVIRGRESCDMPSRRWNKPSIMLICENNYSNAHGTPWVYKNRGIGKLVGMPVPGTMSTVSWERLIDGSLVFGIPIVGYRTSEGYYLENRQLEPDIKVMNTPEKYLNGRDEQTEAAVREMLKQLDMQKIAK